MPSWSPPRLDLDRAQHRCSRDHHQNASEAERDLQGDVAGKRQQNAALSISTVIRRVEELGATASPSRSTRASFSGRHRVAS
jgi:hypothetical protein